MSLYQITVGYGNEDLMSTYMYPCLHFHFQSTSESHSVAANYQKVVSLMKVHSHTLCGAIAASANQREDRKQRRGESCSLVVPSGSLGDMKSMLADLEAEFAGIAR